MRFIIENEELFQLPLKIAQRPRKQPEDADLPHSSSSNYIINNLLQNQQEIIIMQKKTNSRIFRLKVKLAKT